MQISEEHTHKYIFFSPSAVIIWGIYKQSQGCSALRLLSDKNTTSDILVLVEWMKPVCLIIATYSVLVPGQSFHTKSIEEDADLTLRLSN